MAGRIAALVGRKAPLVAASSLAVAFPVVAENFAAELLAVAVSAVAVSAVAVVEYSAVASAVVAIRHFAPCGSFVAVVVGPAVPFVVVKLVESLRSELLRLPTVVVEIENLPVVAVGTVVVAAAVIMPVAEIPVVADLGNFA